MKKVSIEQIALDEKNVEFQPDDSFILSYPEFVAYFADKEEITSDERSKQIHTSMNRKIGYEVTPYRAVELVMFVNGSKLINSST